MISAARRRHPGVDALRVVSIFAVVVGHVPAPAAVHDLVYGWHVPLFFFLSGWFFRPGRSVRSEVQTRWSTIGRPYVAWLMILGSSFLVSQVVRGLVTTTDVARLLWGGAKLTQPFSAFWFMSALFLAALMYRWARERHRGRALAVLVASMYAVAVWAPGLVAAAPLSVGMGVVSLTFVALGEACRSLTSRPTVSQAVIGLISALALMSGLAVGLLPPLDLKNGLVGWPVISFVVAGVICWGLTTAFSVVESLPHTLASTVTRVAEVGTTVVFLHPVFLWLNAWADWPWFARAGLIVVLSWTVALAVDRIRPLARWLNGRSAPAKRVLG